MGYVGLSNQPLELGVVVAGESERPVGVEPPRRRPGRLVAVLVGFATIAAISTGLYWRLQSQVDPHIACDSDVVEVCDAVAFVEQIRGRRFKRQPQVSILDTDEFAVRANSVFNEGRAAPSDDMPVSGEGQLFQILGVISPDENLDAVENTTNVATIDGFYLAEFDEVLIQADEFNLYSQATMVHELTHAWDDQWFDFFGDQFITYSRDEQVAQAAVVEGSASRVELLWIDSLSEADRLDLQEQETRLNQQKAEPPEFYQTARSFPYDQGAVFVSAVQERGGESAVDDLLKTPPETTEQIIHPMAWNDREQAAGFQLPEGRVDRDSFWFDTLGELYVSILLGDAAQGWGDDYYELWRTESQTCAELFLVADTRADLNEMAEAAADYALLHPNIEVDVTSDFVSLEGCLDTEASAVGD